MDKQRAVAYVRVSSNSPEQANSFERQYSHWQEELSNSDRYELVGIYADKGKSGRTIKKRLQFKQMIKDCHEGKIDIIFTKSVTRFGRNVEEILTVVRALREDNVKVIFEKESIDTDSPNSELMLAVAIAIGEDELMVYSENQRWAIRKRYKDGYISVGNKILGYRMDAKTNSLEVEPDEAQVVKNIFQWYIQGSGMDKIAERLIREDIGAKGHEYKWCRSSIRYILTNERYIGNSLQQKTIKENGIQRKNHGEAVQYYMANTHDAIITEDDFKLVQELMRERTAQSLIGQKIVAYDMTSKIKCGICGANYKHKVQNSGKAWAKEVWVCQKQNREGKACCDSTRINDEVLKEKFVECFNELVDSGYRCDQNAILDKRLSELLSAEQELIALRSSYMISIADYETEVSTIRSEIAKIKEEQGKLRIKNITKSDYVHISEYSQDIADKFLDKVIIHKWTVTFRYMNGASITRTYKNGEPGVKINNNRRTE